MIEDVHSVFPQVPAPAAPELIGHRSREVSEGKGKEDDQLGGRSVVAATSNNGS